MNAAKNPSPDVRELLARRETLFGKGAQLFYEQPLHLVRGDGVWLYDANGKQYLDMYNNIPVVGHCNPRVLQAMTRQLAAHTIHSRYLDTGILDYAQRLLALHAPSIESVIFTCTGTEANEVAMNMARMVTGGRGFVCTDATYHGNSALVGSLTRAPRRGRPGVHAIPFPQRYRPIGDQLSEQALCEAYLAELRAAIDDFASEGVKFAGMLICSIYANEGLPDLPAGYLSQAVQMVRAAGGLVILDEVQAGFCRTGHWWGYQLMGVEPDIVTMGKPMGNGMPFGACASRREFVERFRAETRYFNTFAGTPVHAAVGMAVIDEIEARGLRAQVTDVGAYLKRELQGLAPSLQQMGDVRGRGLFVGVDWVKDKASREADRDGAIRMVNRLKDMGALIGHAGALGNILKIRPPLVFDRSHAERFLELFRVAAREARG